MTTVGSERDSTEAGERGEHTAKLHVSLLAGGGQKRTAAAAAGHDEKDGDGEDVAPGASADFSSFGDSYTSITPEQAELEALEVVREVVSPVPEVETNITRPVLFSFKTPVEVEIRGYDLEELARATKAVEERLARVDGLRDVKSSIAPGNPEVQIIYDRDALARMNLDIRKVAELVRDKVQGQEATKFNRKDRKVPIRVRLEGVDDAGVAELKNLVINPGAVRPIPLSAVSKIITGRGPNEIRRIGQQRVGVVTANVEGIGLGRATSKVELALVDVDLPGSMSTAVTGQSQEWETSAASLYLALALSIFLVYVIMASQFESLIYPLIILVTIPLALVGVVIALIALDIPVSVVVFLGGIMLVGIVVNNAIVLVDYMGQLKARGMKTAEAIVLAGSVRLRPILMTTLTTVLGLLPMALGLGDGAEIRQPMAITVIAGLVFSTALTLVVIPTLYQLVDRLTSRRGPSPRESLAQDLAVLDEDALAPEEFGAQPDPVPPGETP